MKRRSTRFLFPPSGAVCALGWLVLAFVAGWPLSRLQAVPFTVTGLTEIKGEGVAFTTFTPRDVNDSGQVVGNARFADGNTRAVLFHNGIFTDLGHLGSGGSEAAAINNAGHVVGTSFVPVPDPDFPGEFFNMPRAFLHNGETMINLGTLPVFDPSSARSEAIAINDAGQIVGTSSFRTGEFSDAFSGPFLFQGVGMTRPDGGGFGIAGMMGLNASGQMIGFGNEQFLGFNAHAFLLDGGALTNLHLLVRGDDVSPASESWPTGINNSGQVVGIHWSFPSLQERHFLFDNGKVTLLPRQPIGINDHGHILCNGGVIIDGAFQSLDELAAGFFTEGATPGFRGLIFGRVGPPPRPTFASPFISNGFITGMGRFFDGTSFSNRPFLLSFTTGETDFTWEGAEGFAFNHGPNWSDGVAPGVGDLVQLTAIQPKIIEFPPSGLVVNRQVRASGNSDTTIDFKSSSWHLVPDESGPDEGGPLVMEGAALRLKRGSMHVRGRASVRNDGNASNGLQLLEGGQLLVRDDLLLGLGATGSQQSTLLVQGEGSRAEAQDIVLGSGGAGGSTTTVTAGGFLEAGRLLQVGTTGPSSAGLLATGATSVLLVKEGGTLEIGAASGDGSVIVTDGAQAILNGVTATLGSETSTGRFTLAGNTSRLFGGSFRVRPQGELLLRQGQGSPQLLSVEGGLATLQDDFLVGGGTGRFEVSSGRLFLQLGASARVGALALTGGRLELLGTAQVLVEPPGDAPGHVTVENATIALGDVSKLKTTGDFSVNGSALTGGGLIRVSTGSTLEVGGHLRIVPFSGQAGRQDAEVLVSGAGSTLIVRQTSLIGAEGPGRLTVENGALAELGNEAFVGIFNAEEGERAASVRVRGEGSRVLAEGLSLFAGTFLTVEDGGSFQVRPGKGLAVAGTAFFESASHLGRLTISNDGGVAIISDAPVTADSARMTDGRLAIGVGSTFVTSTLTIDGGSLLGLGTIDGNVVNNTGRITPGTSPGTLTIEGDYTQNGGTVVLEISGTAPGTQHDQLVVTGNVNLAGGTVEFAFTDGFAPRAGQTFTLIDAGAAFTGTPAVTVSGLQPGWEFNTAINPATGTFALTSLTDGVATAANFPDADDDGLPNDWETANGLDPNDRADAARDPDGDGQSTLNEYRAGTDPRSAASAFALLSVQRGWDGGITLTYTAQNGKTYRVAGSTDLKTWSERLPASTSWATGIRTAVLTPAQAANATFFRVEIVP